MRSLRFVAMALAYATLAAETSAQTRPLTHIIPDADVQRPGDQPAGSPQSQRDGWRPRLALVGGFTREHFDGDADNPEKDLSQSLAAVSGGTEYVPVATQRVRLSVLAQGAANFRQRTFDRREGDVTQRFSGSAVGLSAEAAFQVAVRSGGALDYLVGVDATLFRDAGDVERDPAPASGARGLHLKTSGHRLTAASGVNIRRRATLRVMGEYSRLETHVTTGSGGTMGRPPGSSPPPSPEAKSALRVGPRLTYLITRRISADCQLLFANGYRFQIIGRYALW